MCSGIVDFAESSNEVLKKIHEATLANNLAVAEISFMSFETIVGLVDAESQQEGADSTDDSEALGYLKFFLGEASNFTMSKHLYMLVQFYNWLHTTMAYRLTKEDIYKPALDAIEQLSPANALIGRQLLTNFINAWNKMQRLFLEFNVCPAAARADFKESPIPELTLHEVRLADLLSVDKESPSVIYRMLDGQLVHRQNSYFLRHSSLQTLVRPICADNAAVAVADDANAFVNRFEILCDKLPDVLDLRFLPKYKAAMSSEVIQIDDMQELVDYATAQISVVVEENEQGVRVARKVINKKAICRFILKNYVSGGHILALHSLMTPFLEKQILDNCNGIEIATLPLQKDQQLLMALFEMCQYWKALDSTFEERDATQLESSLLDAKLHKCSEAEATELVNALLASVRWLRSRATSYEELVELQQQKLNVVFSSVISSTTPNMKGALRNILNSIGVTLPVSAIFPMCRRVCEWFSVQEFLFSDLGQDFCQPFSDEIKPLTDTLDSLCAMHSSSALKILKTAADLLNKEDVRQLLRDSRPLDPFSRIVRDKLGVDDGAVSGHHLHPVSTALNAIMCSSEITTGHYAALMRYLRRRCGELTVAIATSSSLSTDEGGDDRSSTLCASGVYVEKVPEDYKRLQNVLFGSEAVENFVYVEDVLSEYDPDLDFSGVIGGLLMQSLGDDDDDDESVVGPGIDINDEDVMESTFSSADVSASQPNSVLQDVGNEVNILPAVARSGVQEGESLFHAAPVVGLASVTSASAMSVLEGSKAVAEMLRSEEFCARAGISEDSLNFLNNLGVLESRSIRGKFIRYNIAEITKFDNPEILVCLENELVRADLATKLDVCREQGLTVIQRVLSSGVEVEGGVPNESWYPVSIDDSRQHSQVAWKFDDRGLPQPPPNPPPVPVPAPPSSQVTLHYLVRAQYLQLVDTLPSMVLSAEELLRDIGMSRCDFDYLVGKGVVKAIAPAVEEDDCASVRDSVLVSLAPSEMLQHFAKTYSLNDDEVDEAVHDLGHRVVTVKGQRYVLKEVMDILANDEA
jgi:hypothetical protein